ncbi:hypothetical protein C7S15_5337 [Burkholderia cepacia]|nr:hypothetical protein [Burkholderia cepacia]
MPVASFPQRAPNVVDMLAGQFHGPDCPCNSGREIANINGLIDRRCQPYGSAPSI